MPRELHPEGRFFGNITDHGFSESKNGADQIFLSIENEDNAAHTITTFLSMNGEVSEAAKGRDPDAKPAVHYTVISLRNAGFTGFDFGELEDGTLLKDNRIGYVIEHETWEGTVRDKVKWINDPNRSGIKRSENAKANATRLNSFLKQNPPTVSPSTAVGPDGIPF